MRTSSAQRLRLTYTSLSGAYRAGRRKRGADLGRTGAVAADCPRVRAASSVSSQAAGLCIVFLDTDAAAVNRDDLSKTLWPLLFSWLNEPINERFCRDDFVTFIGLLDQPPQNLTSPLISFPSTLPTNAPSLRPKESRVAEHTSEGIFRFVPQTPYFDNLECM
jgi:hypothetical protein